LDSNKGRPKELFLTISFFKFGLWTEKSDAL
jgi:hypothetical protein